MTVEKNKNKTEDKHSVILGISAGIAAFKIGNLISLLRDEFDCWVVMTRNAKKLVKPLTFANLTNNPVISSLWKESEFGKPVHIDIADKASVLCIAPATANIIGKISHGIADDALSTIALSVNCPAIIAPAMNVRMYNHPIVQDNLRRLERFGYHIIEPEEGWLACGIEGKGKLANVEKIAEAIRDAIAGKIKPPQAH